jgi:hypothetical protein
MAFPRKAWYVFSVPVFLFPTAREATEFLQPVRASEIPSRSHALDKAVHLSTRIRGRSHSLAVFEREELFKAAGVSTGDRRLDVGNRQSTHAERVRRAFPRGSVGTRTKSLAIANLSLFEWYWD